MSMPTTYRKCPAEPRDSKQLIFRFWEQLTQHALTSSLLHLFSIGLNSDEAGDLLFFLHFVRWVSDCYKTIISVVASDHIQRITAKSTRQHTKLQVAGLYRGRRHVQYTQFVCLGTFPHSEVPLASSNWHGFLQNLLMSTK